MLQFTLQPPRTRPCHRGYKSHLLPKADGDVGSSEAGVQRSPVGTGTPMHKYFIWCLFLYSTRQAAEAVGHYRDVGACSTEGSNDPWQSPSK